jgi:ABC-type multidrug transport system fused ATPase/permease subunit
MDKIIVIRDGEIIEEGTFSDLLRNEGVFGNMAQRQTFTTTTALAS